MAEALVGHDEELANVGDAKAYAFEQRLGWHRKNDPLHRELAAFKARLRNKIGVRPTDRLQFFFYGRKVFVYAYSPRSDGVVTFQLKDPKAIDAVRYFNRRIKRIL
jgi:hypothetical protein